MTDRGQAIVDQLRQAGLLDATVLCGAEIGIWNGELSAWLLDRIPSLHLYMVDWWQPTCTRNVAAKRQPGASSPVERHLERKRQALKRTAFAETRRTVLHMSSSAAARCVPNARLDFAYIDAGHTFREVLADLLAWHPCVRSGGLLCGHDIDHPANGTPGAEAWDVRRAVEAWMTRARIDGPILLGRDTTWFVRIP